MSEAILFIYMNERRAGNNGFQITGKNVKFARLPTIGEVINLGDDTKGHSADYKVVLVHHAPFRPNGIDAEIYLERIDIAHELVTLHDVLASRSTPEADNLPASL